MEDEGAGAIVRSWMPWRGQSDPTTTSTIRFYLDGDTEPVIEGNMFELFQGKGLIPYPLAHESLRSAVSFFPIPYAKGCKVTVTEQPFFFQFTYREYLDDTAVTTFTMDDFHAAVPLMEQVGKRLLAPQDKAIGEKVALATHLAANAEKSIDLPAGEAGHGSLVGDGLRHGLRRGNLLVR